MNRFFVAVIVLIISLNLHAKADGRLDSLLLVLDKVILSDKYKEHKENELSSLKYRLNNQNLTIDRQYFIYSELTSEYEFYRCDSAYRYAQKLYDTALKTGSNDLVNNSKIQQASILLKAAMFNEAVQLLNGIDENELTPNQRFEYYKTFYETYVTWVDFYEGGYENGELFEKRDYYYEAFLETIPEDSYEHASRYGIKYIITGDYDRAEEVLIGFLPKVKLGTRPYSILASVLSFLYQSKGDTEKVKEYLALSALSDVQGNIMENASLRELAELLFEEGDTKRANTYIKRSMEDANFYNTRIRNIKISRVLPIIDDAYQMDKAPI